LEGREKRAIGGPGFFFLNETREKGERGLKKKHFIHFTLCKRRAGLGPQKHGQGSVYVVGEEDARLKKRREKERERGRERKKLDCLLFFLLLHFAFFFTVSIK
jgi:hypothetical protein